MAQPPYVKSNFPRVPGDYYPTIDKRCVYALLQHLPVRKQQIIFDVCAPQGSGIISTFKELGYSGSFCKPDAFDEVVMADWIATNPPFTRPLVDQIIERQIERVRHNHVGGFACLLRSNFDFAKTRKHIFQNEPLYYGKIQMLFRPYWFEKREGDKEPIHHYVWHIWRYSREPFYNKTIMYADGTLFIEVKPT
ncbi:MAG: hypothetical protein HY865_22035 [Chloroflexi bacterium]|nr:hypothetical protein [Chloroflexota bacterium]